MSAPDLEARVGRLEAIEQVRGMLVDYVAACDGLVANALQDMFTEDAELHSLAGVVTGRAAIVDYYHGVLSNLTAARHHVINSTIELDGPDRALHCSYFQAFLTKGDETTIVFGDYADVLVRGADGSWRFREKRNHGRGTISLGADSQSQVVQPASKEG